MAWERTALSSPAIATSWRKMNDEEIRVSGPLPGNALDHPERAQCVGHRPEKYNERLTLTPEEDAVFDQLAGNAPAPPPGTYLTIPLRRAFRMGLPRE